jgi:ketosteroid isomerase-like protein
VLPRLAWAIGTRLPRRLGAAVIAATVRSEYSRWNRTGSLDERLLDPEIEWRPPPESPHAGTYRGREQAAAELATWSGPFEDFRWEVREVIDAGLEDGQWTWVLCGRMSGRGRGSGARTEVDEYHVWTLRDSRAVRLHMYLDRAAALAAAGLDEPSE